MTQQAATPTARLWWRAVGVAVLAAAAALALFLTSLGGADRLQYDAPAPAALGPQEAIAGWAAFDRSNVLPGDRLAYTIRLQWRASEVTPELETLATGSRLYPFDNNGSTIRERRLAGGVREYVVEYALQAVDVRWPGSHQLAAATVYYTANDPERNELQALRIVPPPLYIGEHLPANVADIPLRPLKPAFALDDRGRSLLMLFFGAVLGGSGLYLLWVFGRRRPPEQLSDGERLWLDLERLESQAGEAAARLHRAERLCTAALQLRTGVPPSRLWSGQSAGGPRWRERIAVVRECLAATYRPGTDAEQSLRRIAALTRELLAPLVEAGRLERERRPSAVARLLGEPRVVAAACAMLLLAAGLAGLAMQPAAWFARDAIDYNRAMERLADAPALEAAADAFSQVAAASDQPAVRAAAWYNAGTLRADTRLSPLPPTLHRDFLRAVFTPDVTLDVLLHTLELDAEAEFVPILSDYARRYVAAESALQAAVRSDPQDADIRRNLEILSKQRRALARTMETLLAASQEGESAAPLRSQTVIDLRVLMETEMPEDYARSDAGKDDRNYYIMERF